MTTFLGLLLSVTLLASPITKAGMQNQHSVAQTERLATTEMTFSVQNSTPIVVGPVTVNEADQGSVKIFVPGPGTFSGTLTAPAVGVMINGQPLPQGVPTWIMIDAHTSVRANWTGNIIVIDQDEMI